MPIKEKWSIMDLSAAMEQSVLTYANPRFLRSAGDKLTFNGFWRDGNRVNVCMWLKTATWADAKTGEGGGCKEFARVAFNSSLSEFMERFGRRVLKSISKPAQKMEPPPATSVNELWLKILERQKERINPAEYWLQNERGFENPKANIGSGFASLAQDDISLFEEVYHTFIRSQLSIGPQLIAPLRNFYSDKVQNLFFRILSPAHKDQKSRLLPNRGGWGEPDGSPRAFGFPHLIKDFPSLIICEGMADYFATECLLGCNNDFLAIGAANAQALSNWAQWLVAAKYKGKVTLLYQLDLDQKGQLTSNGVGQMHAVKALKLLLEGKSNANLFKWPSFIRLIGIQENMPKDIADVCKQFGTQAISDRFLTTLKDIN